jgi:hypothetical protein
VGGQGKIVKKPWVVFSFLILLMAGCTLSTIQRPELSRDLSPATVVAGSAGFNLTLAGSDFTSTCKVFWNGSQRTTQVINSTEAVAAITSADVASAGTAIVAVMDMRTGLESDPVPFVISQAVSAAATVGVTINPPSASLVTGGSVQFTATVTGSSNTAVSWATTGGTVTTGGFYTAPITTGSFTVKATSVADNTKSASAVVSVNATIQHTVTLTWAASPSVAGYNVYRGTVSGGPYTRINTALEAATNYLDSTVQSGETYFYAVTSVDSSGMESAFSSPVTVVVPSP